MIKFRAWHRELGRMMSIKNMWFQDSRIEELELNDAIMNDYITVSPDEIELMQSTGLKDKNGKEIFEGDILKSNKYITSVFYERGAYCVKFSRTPNTTVTMNVISFIEKYKTKIIGNIYENPELLEVEG
nr:MAG TPA: YopX protein [Caudoviricetes sp.]